QARDRAMLLRIGAIDSAAAGLLPLLLQDLRAAHPGLEVRMVEDKTIRLLPRLLSGRLDLAFLRPPETRDPRLVFRHLFFETAVVALHEGHALARGDAITVEDLRGQPMIVPDRRARPHSHDLTVKLFADAGFGARVAQVADEKQTIVNLVAAGIGLAIVPRWAARLAVPGVVFRPLADASQATRSRLPLSAAYLRSTRDSARDAALDVVASRLAAYAAQA
ncbi:MAG TPA: LysR family substrate-binding domain-containing protein, partial [Beijerinckiaceae bacterium]|nr:LysR family substrate-binding domain-containing protein [Beijerinckiaceae bacterium]